MGEEITYIVPTGNLGDGLAAFYAKIMGIPIKKIVLAVNQNSVLPDFVNTGLYDLRNAFTVNVNTPAMTVKIPSNLERILHYLFGDLRTYELMNSLEANKFLQLTNAEKQIIQSIFSSDFATNDEVRQEINYVFYKYKYLMDPHTATSFVVRTKLGLFHERCLHISTASWTKFSGTISEVFGVENNLKVIAKRLKVELPKFINELDKLPVVHDKVIGIEDMENVLLEFLSR